MPVFGADIDRSYFLSDEEIKNLYPRSVEERGPDAQREALAKLEASLESSKTLPVEERIKFLGSALQKLPRKNIYQVPERIEIFDRVQAELLSIPGHAEYYDERIREAYADFKDPDSPRHTGSADRFSNEMMYGFRALSYLPSPETVKVLGEMLAEDWQAPRSPGVISPSSLAIAAVKPLAELSIVDSPTAALPDHLAKENLPLWRDWYSMVKSGKRSFSFKGQSEEYRFTPDGKWETIAVTHRDNEVRRKPGAARSNSEPLSLPAKDKFLGKNKWPWIAAAAVCAAVVFWLFWFGKKPKGW